MFSRLSRNRHFNGTGSIFLKSLFNFCSTTIKSAHSKEVFLADFLVESLGFSRETAIRKSNKVTRAKPALHKPALVVNYLENLGVNKTQIRKIVSSDPNLLFYDVEKTLEPKVRFFRELGFSGSELGRLISACLLKLGLDSCIIPRTDYLRKLLGSDEKVALVLKRCYFVLNFDPERVEKNILVLRNFGLSDDSIVKLIIWNPRLFLGTLPQFMENSLLRVENDLGIPRYSSMFVYGVRLITATTQSNLEGKFEYLRSYGFSDVDILKMIRNFPHCMIISKDKMRKTLDYFMKELGYDIDYLASHPRLLSFDLERRVKPRNKVLKILKERKLTRSSLYTALLKSESRFLEDYVRPHKDELPNLYESYINKIKRHEIEAL